MNNRIKIYGFKVDFKDGSSVNIAESASEISLSPFYASIRDIELNVPAENVSFNEQFSKDVSEIIFNKSIWIDNYIRRKKLRLTDEELYMIKRDFVICSVLAGVANKLYGTLLKGQSVKKVLGDFEVQRDSTFDVSSALKFANESKQCADDVLAAIDDASTLLAVGFVKGKGNCSNRVSNREWHHPGYRSIIPVAANKFLELDGKLYKTGYGHGNEPFPLYRRG